MESWKAKKRRTFSDSVLFIARLKTDLRRLENKQRDVRDLSPPKRITVNSDPYLSPRTPGRLPPDSRVSSLPRSPLTSQLSQSSVRRAITTPAYTNNNIDDDDDDHYDAATRALLAVPSHGAGAFPAQNTSNNTAAHDPLDQLLEDSLYHTPIPDHILHAFMELSRDDAAWKAEALDDNGRPRLWCNCPLDPRAPPNPPVRQPRFSTQVPVESRAADARAHIPLRNLGEGWPHFAVCAQCFAVVHIDGSSTVIQSDSVVVDDAMQ